MTSTYRRIYDRITHAQRIQVLYLKTVHDLPLKDIQALSGVKYNTIRNLLRTFRKSGRTNKRGNCQYRHSTAQVRSPKVSRAVISLNLEEASPSPEGVRAQSGEASGSALQVHTMLTPNQSNASLPRKKLINIQLHVGESFDVSEPSTAQSSSLSIRRSDPSSEEAEEMTPKDLDLIPSDVTTFETYRECKLKLFSGPLEKLNQLIVSTGDVPLALKREDQAVSEPILAALRPRPSNE